MAPLACCGTRPTRSHVWGAGARLSLLARCLGLGWHACAGERGFHRNPPPPAGHRPLPAGKSNHGTEFRILVACRRQIQLQTGARLAWQVAAGNILREEGIRGFYRGLVPNTLKNLPNKGGWEVWCGAGGGGGGWKVWLGWLVWVWGVGGQGVGDSSGCASWWGWGLSGGVVGGLRYGCDNGFMDPGCLCGLAARAPVEVGCTV